jgi:hypothetical protein
MSHIATSFARVFHDLIKCRFEPGKRDICHIIDGHSPRRLTGVSSINQFEPLGDLSAFGITKFRKQVFDLSRDVIQRA